MIDTKRISQRCSTIYHKMHFLAHGLMPVQSFLPYSPQFSVKQQNMLKKKSNTIISCFSLYEMERKNHAGNYEKQSYNHFVHTHSSQFSYPVQLFSKKASTKN